MRKLFSILLGFIIFILLLVLAINITIESIVSYNITNIMVKDKVSDIVTDAIYDIYPNITTENLLKIEEVISNSREVRDIADKYLDDMVEYVMEEDSEYIDISLDLDDLILHNRDKLVEYGISNEDIDLIVNKLETDANIDNAVYDKFVGNLSDTQKVSIAMYGLASSDSLRYGLIIGIIFLILIICLINWNFYSWLLYSGSNTIIAGLIIKVVFIEGINTFSGDITNNILGRTSDIDVSLLDVTSIVYMVVGIVMVVLYWVVKKLFYANK